MQPLCGINTFAKIAGEGAELQIAYCSEQTDVEMIRLLANLQAYWHKRGEPPEPHVLFNEMGAWWQTPLGQALLANETALLEPVLTRIFGYHFLQLGVSEHSMLAASPVGHKLLFTPQYDCLKTLPVADNETLPLQNESVDAVLIHHALDYTPDSHRLLREAARVLMPGGKLLILGFNPLSTWGLRHLFRIRDAKPWDARYISRTRVQDWLKLLEFTVDKVQHGAYLLPWKHSRLVHAAPQIETFGHRLNTPLGAVYLIVACKQVIPITPIMPRWPRLPHPVLVRPVGETARSRPQAAKVKITLSQKSDTFRKP